MLGNAEQSSVCWGVLGEVGEARVAGHGIVPDGGGCRGARSGVWSELGALGGGRSSFSSLQVRRFLVVAGWAGGVMGTFSLGARSSKKLSAANSLMGDNGEARVLGWEGAA